MKKTDRIKNKKLEVKPDPIRQLTPTDLSRVAGGAPTGLCNNDSGNDTLRMSCSCLNCSNY